MMEKIFKQMQALCSGKELNEDRYISILEKAVMPKPKRRANSFMDALEAEADSNYNYVTNYPDNSVVRLLFGEKYLYYNLCKRLSDMGIGHVHEFYIKGRSIFVDIYLSVCIRKKENETKQSYEARKSEFLSMFPYELADSEKNKIKDTERNRKILLGSLLEFMDIRSCSIFARNDYLYKVSLHVCDIKLYKGKTENVEKSFSLVSVEQIEKECSSALDALSMYGIGLCDDVIESIVSSCYYRICCIAGYRNNFCTEYEKIVLSNRDRNRMVKEQIGKIGSSVTVCEMFDTLNGITDKIQKRFAGELCFSGDLSWHMGLRFSGSFSPNICSMYAENEDSSFLEQEFAFDQYLVCKKDFSIYCIGTDYVKEVREKFMSEFGAFNIEIKCSEYDGKFCITGVSGMIDDVLKISS